MISQLAVVETSATLYRPEFWGAADHAVGSDSASRELLTIEPYDTEVLPRERVSARSARDRGLLAFHLRRLDTYLHEIRRAA